MNARKAGKVFGKVCKFVFGAVYTAWVGGCIYKGARLIVES